MQVTKIIGSYFKFASKLCYTKVMKKQKLSQKRRAKDIKRSPCPVANLLDIVGDKWTMLIIRDLFMGKKTYSEFENSYEGIRTNILAERLKRLEFAGIIDKSPYQERPVRYQYTLTEKGKALGPVLKAMKNWGLKYIAGTYIPER